MTLCSKRIWLDGWHKGQCSRIATVERDGKPYCTQHDPVRVQEREEKRQAKAKTKQCPKCGSSPKHWWAYCPLCGTKYPGH
ncbi:hypothetical protein LCGC14_0845880 [marine sediment metagenome]|uniref:Zinc-ribbon domain-containing protein n=1 Tax=marine sediment metagenome TaxID=412755 RepID=A0A0F9PX36_9ZZZZ